MNDLPYGYLIGVLITGALVALTLTAPRRPRWLANLGFRVASVYNEAPLLFVYLIVVSSVGPVAGGQLNHRQVGWSSVPPPSWSSIEGRELLFRLASRGWVTISASYRLRPHADFFDHLIDVKRVIAWVREHGAEYGADPSTLFLSGGSAGGQLSSMAALTQSEPEYQPGFEDADTSVTAVASLCGWYGGYYEMGDSESEVGVLGHAADHAPPFFIALGAEDSLATGETARRFVAHLRGASPSRVVYAELPHGQHAFDLFHSFRFSAVIDGIEEFAAAVRTPNRCR